MKKFRIDFMSISKDSQYYFEDSTLILVARNQIEALRKFYASIDCIHGLYIKEIKECSKDE